MVEILDCLKCATQCCSGTAVRLFPEEVKRILAYKPNMLTSIDRLVEGYYVMAFRKKCPMLSKDGLCQMRIDGLVPPLFCQLGPFYINQEVVGDNRVLLMPARNSVCPKAKSVPFEGEFEDLFLLIVDRLREMSPEIVFIVNDEFLLEGNYW